MQIAMPTPRVGLGTDVHRLTENRDLILLGVKIPFEKGLLGHSDADVVAHAVIDALLGASGMGDIGEWFPDNDQQYKDADSMQLLQTVWQRVADTYLLGNVDITITAQKPKLFPYKEAMRANLAKIFNCPISQINIKAKTNEQLGYLGRCEAIEALAIAVLFKVPDCETKL